MAKNGKTFRGVRFRLLPNEKQESLLHGICGACRKVWNVFLGRNQKQYAKAKANDTEGPSTRWQTLFTEFTELRNSPEYAWLQEYFFTRVRHTLKQLSRAWANYFEGRAQKPRFHAKHRTTPSFTIPEDVKIRDDNLHIPEIGWVQLRRKGGHPYPDGVPKQAHVRRQGKNWYVSVTYEIDEPVLVDNGVVAGIDWNASGMIAVVYSDDTPAEVMDQPTKKVYAVQKRRKLARQRARQKADGRPEISNRAKRTKEQIARLCEKEKNCRHNRNHQNSARVAKKASTVKIENLSVSGMTRSAKGTVENPGTNVQAKAGLNRVLLEGTPGQLGQMLDYKCLAVLCVMAAYTSQDCSRCGHRDGNRASLRKFRCLSCGYFGISMRPRTYSWPPGLGQLDERGAFPSGTPMTRQSNVCLPHVNMGPQVYKPLQEGVITALELKTWDIEDDGCC